MCVRCEYFLTTRLNESQKKDRNVFKYTRSHRQRAAAANEGKRMTVEPIRNGWKRKITLRVDSTLLAKSEILIEFQIYIYIERERYIYLCFAMETIQLFSVEVAVCSFFCNVVFRIFFVCFYSLMFFLALLILHIV